MRSQLIFGLPATAALIFIIALALRRTRRLYAEAAGRQAAEDALKQAQRLEALGQLTGGVAHDFNNLLMVIGGSVERLKSRIRDPQTGRSLSMIEAAVHKGASLTKQLLSFSRRQSLSPRVWDAVACVRDFREVLQQSLRGDIQIDFDLPEGPLPSAWIATNSKLRSSISSLMRAMPCRTEVPSALALPEKSCRRKRIRTGGMATSFRSR